MILPNPVSGTGVQQIILTAAAPTGERLELVVFADGTWGVTRDGLPVRREYVADPADDGPGTELMHLFMALAGLPIECSRR